MQLYKKIIKTNKEKTPPTTRTGICNLKVQFLNQNQHFQISRFPAQTIVSNLSLIDLKASVMFTTQRESFEQFESEKEAGEKVPAAPKKANHFAFIERASQTKQFDVQDTECQTDPPPM